MKKTPILLLITTVLVAGLSACKKNTGEMTPAALTAAEKAKINAYGLSAEEAYRTDGGYVAERDIFISNEDINNIPANPLILRVGNAEQYHVVNLVTGLPRTITIRYTGNAAGVTAALDNVITLYNSMGLRLRFMRVASGSPANITISNASGGSYIALSSFPSASGNPGSSIVLNTAYNSSGVQVLTRIIRHEIGHCIGLAHTDYMLPSFSCGPGVSPATGTYIHIPGTPTGPDPNSFMLTCYNLNMSNVSSANDAIALQYLYGP